MRIVIGDRIVRLKDSHYHFDYGVKGMKKGVRHEDPPTGGGQKSGASKAQQTKAANGRSKALRNMALAGGGMALAGLGLGLLARKHLKNITGGVSSAARNAVTKAKNAATHASTAASNAAHNIGRMSQHEFKNVTNHARQVASGAKKISAESTEQFRKHLADPHYVFDI